MRRPAKFKFKSKTVRLPWDEARCRAFFGLHDGDASPKSYSVTVSQNTALYTCEATAKTGPAWRTTYKVKTKNHLNLSTWVAV
jgi:hypothetical protein